MESQQSPNKEPMETFSCRLPVSLKDRLERAKWALKKNKQDVVRQALEELFDRHKVE